MNLYSSLNIGITGVQAQSSVINTISGNIANADTVGYKEGVTSFADLVYDMSANNYSVNGAGSPTAYYSPSGVDASVVQFNEVAGQIENTTSSTDLAINGNGFFPIIPQGSTGTDALEYTRAGSFIMNADGEYENAAGGVLQGWAFDTNGNLPASLQGSDVSSSAALGALVPINISNITITPEATTEVSLQANLDAAQPNYDSTPVYDPSLSTNNMASGAVSPNFTVPLTVVDSTGATHSLVAAFLKGPMVLSDGGAGPFSGVTSGGTTMTVTGPVPPGLAVGDSVTFNGAGAILDSNGNTMLTAAQMNAAHTVLSVSGNSYTVSTAAATGGDAATGSVSFTSNPNAGDTVNLNGVTWTFVSSGATGNETNIGGNLSATLTQLASDLNNSSAAGLETPTAQYSATSTSLDVSYNTESATSNNYTLGGATLATQNLSGGSVGSEATGTLTFAANPSAGDTVDINGTTWTFVTGGATGNETDIGGNLSATLNNLANDLGNSTDSNVDQATYTASPASPSSTSLDITFDTVGSSGNSFTFAGVAPADSGATLTGGAATTNSGGVSTAGGVGPIDEITNNTWAVEVYANPPTDVTAANGQVASGTVSFNGDGTLASISSGLSQAIPVSWTDAGATASAITINWGTAGAEGVGMANGLQQLTGNYTVSSTQHNGTPSDVGQTISIGSNGIVTATYSDGSTRSLYQIPLAQFRNADALQGLSSNAYVQTEDSGAPIFYSPGQSGEGSLDVSALEQSNVDLASQLTNMIVAQNAYTANTKIISTSDEMLQTLTSMDQSVSV